MMVQVCSIFYSRRFAVTARPHRSRSSLEVIFVELKLSWTVLGPMLADLSTHGEIRAPFSAGVQRLQSM